MTPREACAPESLLPSITRIEGVGIYTDVFSDMIRQAKVLFAHTFLNYQYA